MLHSWSPSLPGKPYNFKVDLWSLGITLYQVLSGLNITDIGEERRRSRPLPAHLSSPTETEVETLTSLEPAKHRHQDICKAFPGEVYSPTPLNSLSFPFPSPPLALLSAPSRLPSSPLTSGAGVGSPQRGGQGPDCMPPQDRS
eukprot:752371-Hanusia_phi.AAC.2